MQVQSNTVMFGAVRKITPQHTRQLQKNGGVPKIVTTYPDQRADEIIMVIGGKHYALSGADRTKFETARTTYKLAEGRHNKRRAFHNNRDTSAFPKAVAQYQSILEKLAHQAN